MKIAIVKLSELVNQHNPRFSDWRAETHIKRLAKMGYDNRLSRLNADGTFTPIERSEAMKLTKKQKNAIRAHYPHYWKLRFRADGTVEAQKAEGCAYGILYHPHQTRQHLESIKDDKVKK